MIRWILIQLRMVHNFFIPFGCFSKNCLDVLLRKICFEADMENGRLLKIVFPKENRSYLKVKIDLDTEKN